MDPYVGEIRAFGFNFAPRGWAFCAGQLMQISQNTALFSLLGTLYGGDGRSTFGLPDLRNTVANGAGQGPGMAQYFQGERAGATNVTLLQTELASHNHQLLATTSNGTALTANGNVLAVPFIPGGRGQDGTSGLIYSTNPSNATTALSAKSIAAAGGDGAHNNMQPFMAINFCIALQGIFPPRP